MDVAPSGMVVVGRRGPERNRPEDPAAAVRKPPSSGHRHSRPIMVSSPGRAATPTSRGPGPPHQFGPEASPTDTPCCGAARHDGHYGPEPTTQHIEESSEHPFCHIRAPTPPYDPNIGYCESAHHRAHTAHRTDVRPPPQRHRCCPPQCSTWNADGTEGEERARTNELARAGRVPPSAPPT
jgi:hypothetical protein